MTTPAPYDPKAPSNDPATTPEAGVPIGPSFEDRLREFWEKNSKAIYAVCAVVLLAILARGAYQYYEREKEAEIQADYAAATTPEKLKSFISANPEHSLAAAAALTLGDDAYRAGNYAEAATQYQRAADVLKSGPLAGRARLGLAMAKIGQGQTADGEEKLKQLANDVAVLKAQRSEAAYHLASMALEAGRTEDATKYLELAASVDQSGIWAQRAMGLRATLPAPATAPTAVTAPEVSVKAPTP
jgi:predicted negative regulator of RcsB-dependent stress response